MNNRHSLHRTSPFGEKFIGNCRLCGERGLEIDDISECPNIRGLTNEENLLEALESSQNNDPKEWMPKEQPNE